MKAGSPFIFLQHTTLDMVLPKVPFLLALLNTLSGTVYTNCCSFKDGHILICTDNILVSDLSSLVPARGAPALHLVIATHLPSHLGARLDPVWPLGLVSCTVLAVCLGCPNANLHIPDVSTNNLSLDKPVTSY